MDEKLKCCKCGMPPISWARRCLNWPFAMIMAAFGAPMFFCLRCGRCQLPVKKRSDARLT